MQLHLAQLWSLCMTVVVLVMAFPHGKRGFLESALGFGLREVNKHAILRHVGVTRFREPQSDQGLVMIRNDLDVSFEPELIHMTNIKSSSYKQKILQFNSNGQTNNDQGLDYFSTKRGKVNTRRLKASSGDNGDRFKDDNDHWKISLLPKPDKPSFSPLIGASALTNIPQFFKHLRDNIRAIHRSNCQHHPFPLVTSPQSLVSAGSKNDADKFGENEGIKFAGGKSTKKSSGDQMSNKANDDSNSREPDDKELLHFLGRRQYPYPKANNYNPAWSLTGLGFGKRSISPSGGGKTTRFLM